MRRILWTLLLFVSLTTLVVGQEGTPNILLMVERDESLTLYIAASEPVSLIGLSFRVVNSLGTFQTFKIEEGFASLRLTGGIAQPGSCFVYTQAGKSPVLTSICSTPNRVFRIEVPRADVFWYDFTTNRQRDIAIVADDTPTGDICTAAVVECPFIYNAPELSIIPLVSDERPTATPEPTPLQGQSVVLYAEDSIELVTSESPMISDRESVKLSSGTLAQIESVIPEFDGIQYWYRIIISPDGVEGWVKQSHFILLTVQKEEYFNDVCPGASGFHFEIGQRFIVPISGGATSVRAKPNGNPVIGKINEGEEGIILDGPECRAGQQGNLVAWYVESDSGLKGWVSEGYADSIVPWIIPLPISRP